MTNEVDNKKPEQVENETQAKDASSGINSLELLQQGSGAAAAHAAADSISNSAKDLIGKLEITGKLNDKSETVKKLEDFMNGKEVFEKFRPLSALENQVLGGMEKAVSSGNVDSIRESLQALRDLGKLDPKSVDRVMQEFADRMSKENPLNSASWERGKDSNGTEFLRLRLNHQDSFSKSSGGTEVTIGSDGRHSASYRDTFNSPATPMSPEKAMYEFSPKRYYKPEFENWINKPQLDLKPGIIENYDHYKKEQK